MSKKYVDVEIELPVEIINFLEQEAKRREITVDELVNEILEKAIESSEKIDNI